MNKNNRNTWIVAGVLILVLLMLWSRKSLYQQIADISFAGGQKFQVGVMDGPGPAQNDRMVIDYTGPAR